MFLELFIISTVVFMCQLGFKKLKHRKDIAKKVQEDNNNIKYIELLSKLDILIEERKEILLEFLTIRDILLKVEKQDPKLMQKFIVLKELLETNQKQQENLQLKRKSLSK
jgi:hypothetical protein